MLTESEFLLTENSPSSRTKVGLVFLFSQDLLISVVLLPSRQQIENTKRVQKTFWLAKVDNVRLYKAEINSA